MFTGSVSSGEGLEGVRRPDRDAKRDLIEYVTNHYPDRYFTFDRRQVVSGSAPITGCPSATCWNCWQRRPASRC
jgi:hypothetical protein